MAYITKYHNLNIAEFEYASNSANAAAVTSAVFTEDAHLQSAFPNHDYIARDAWERTSVSIYHQDGSGNATVNAFKARVFISLDGNIWHFWVDLYGPNVTIVDMPFRFIKVVRDNTTTGTVKTVFLSQLTHTA